MKTIEKKFNGFKNNFSLFQALAISMQGQVQVKGGGDGDGDGDGGAAGFIVEEIVVQ